MRPLCLLLLVACSPYGDDAYPTDPIYDFNSDGSDPTVADVPDEPALPGVYEHLAGTPTAPIPTEAGPSGLLVSPDDGETMAIIDEDNGGLFFVRQAPSRMDYVELGGEPTRAVAAPDHIYVTLRTAGAVAHLERRGAEWVVADTVEVGAEPYGIALVGGVLYVALSQEDAVVALDPTTLQQQWREHVPHEPRWLLAAVDDLERPGVVAMSAADPRVTWIPAHAPSSHVQLPERNRYADSQFNCVQRPLTARLTGDGSFENGEILLPGMYADTQLRDALDAPPACEATTEVVTMYYGPPTEVLADDNSPVIRHRWNPVVQRYRFDGGELVAGDTVLALERSTDLVRGVITSVHHDRLGSGVVATMESSAAAVIMISKADGYGNDGVGGDMVRWPDLRKRTRPMPRTTIAGHRIWSWSLTDRRLESWNVGNISVAPDLTHETDLPRYMSGPTATDYPSVLSAEIRHGRALFHTSNPSTAIENSGAACSNCHTEARTDHITWQLIQGDRQTPSLAGRVSETMPATWTEDVPSTADEAMETANRRMGGNLKAADSEAIAAYLDWTREVIRPAGDHALVVEGEAVFHRADVGCSTCHSGDRGTDNRFHRVFDHEERTNTPVLSGVAATAPYLHDGSAPTLRDVLVRARNGQMGDTSMLSEREMHALEAYLKQF